MKIKLHAFIFLLIAAMNLIVVPAMNAEEMKSQKLTMIASKNYLLIPVKNGITKSKMTISVDEKIVRRFDIEISPTAQADWMAPLDISSFRGKNLEFSIDSPLPKILREIALSDEIGVSSDYQEKSRPQLHFTSRRGWINDPNGLIYANGYWHLFYQHNPAGLKWGNISWGHALSADLVHWQEIGDALFSGEHALRDCFSGSAVIDKDNTAGFGKNAMILFFTDTGCGESIAYSQDNGKTFKAYDRNPVIRHYGRDPKVFWHEPSQRWCMAVFNGRKAEPTIAIYTSNDLKNWSLQSHVAGFFECPELFELPVDNNRNDKRWVIYGASNEYVVGTFDGKNFSPEFEDRIKGHYGNSLYAAQTYNDAPDNRRIQVGWGFNQFPGVPCSGLMTLPVELSLHSTENGTRMFALPVKELELLRDVRKDFVNMKLVPGKIQFPDISGELFDISAEIIPGKAEKVGIEINGYPVLYDKISGSLACMDSRAPLKLKNGRLTLRIIADRGILEIFANGGEIYMPVRIGPYKERGLFMISDGTDAVLKRAVIYTMKSIWEKIQK